MQKGLTLRGELTYYVNCLAADRGKGGGFHVKGDNQKGAVGRYPSFKAYTLLSGLGGLFFHLCRYSAERLSLASPLPPFSIMLAPA